jgi:hypothetical protein
MIVAGLSPYSDVQLAAELWLREYFCNFGDTTPNSRVVHVSIDTKENLWAEYKVEQERIGLDYVTRQRFLKLWSVLYPYNELRPFVSITGKCNTCQAIDTARRKAPAADELRALQQCHFLHRAGLFMLERMW